MQIYVTLSIFWYQKFQITRLEILSRPKAPKILQELLSNSEELPSPRPTKLLTNSKRFKRFKKIPNESKRIQKITKDSKKIPKDSRRFQKIPEDSKRFQKIPKILKNFKQLISKEFFVIKQPARAQKANGSSSSPSFSSVEESKIQRQPRWQGTKQLIKIVFQHDFLEREPIIKSDFLLVYMWFVA